MEELLSSTESAAILGNIHAQMLALYGMKEKFMQLNAATETCKNKLDLALYTQTNDSLPYISYHRSMCEKLKYALELREELEDFIECAEEHALFAGLVRGFEYPQALEYIKDVVDPEGLNEPMTIYDGSYFNESDDDDTLDYYKGYFANYDEEAWLEYGDDYYGENEYF